MPHKKQDYEIHELIGKGGFAMVFSGTCKLNNQKVAIKVVCNSVNLFCQKN